VNSVRSERGCAWRCGISRQAVSTIIDNFEVLGGMDYSTFVIMDFGFIY